jgi:hypothetical protein
MFLWSDNSLTTLLESPRPVTRSLFSLTLLTSERRTYPNSVVVGMEPFSPMLSVRRRAKAIEYYKAVFGTEELFRIGDDDCGVVAQMSGAGST